MTRPLIAYAATAAVMLLLDALWLGVIARPVYSAAIGHLMAEQPNLLAALAFYLLYPAGVVRFAVLPHSGIGAAGSAARAGALFGLFAYATYDLTNLATLRDWPVGVALLDMAWGAALSGAAAWAGARALRRWGAAAG